MVSFSQSMDATTEGLQIDHKRAQSDYDFPRNLNWFPSDEETCSSSIQICVSAASSRVESGRRNENGGILIPTGSRKRDEKRGLPTPTGSGRRSDARVFCETQTIAPGRTIPGAGSSELRKSASQKGSRGNLRRDRSLNYSRNLLTGFRGASVLAARPIHLFSRYDDYSVGPQTTFFSLIPVDPSRVNETTGEPQSPQMSCLGKVKHKRDKSPRAVEVAIEDLARMDINDGVIPISAPIRTAVPETEFQSKNSVKWHKRSLRKDESSGLQLEDSVKLKEMEPFKLHREDFSKVQTAPRCKFQDRDSFKSQRRRREDSFGMQLEESIKVKNMENFKVQEAEYFKAQTIPADKSEIIDSFKSHRRTLRREPSAGLQFSESSYQLNDMLHKEEYFKVRSVPITEFKNIDSFKSQKRDLGMEESLGVEFGDGRVLGVKLKDMLHKVKDFKGQKERSLQLLKEESCRQQEKRNILVDGVPRFDLGRNLVEQGFSKHIDRSCIRIDARLTRCRRVVDARVLEALEQAVEQAVEEEAKLESPAHRNSIRNLNHFLKQKLVRSSIVKGEFVCGGKFAGASPRSERPENEFDRPEVHLGCFASDFYSASKTESSTDENSHQNVVVVQTRLWCSGVMKSCEC